MPGKQHAKAFTTVGALSAAYVAADARRDKLLAQIARLKARLERTSQPYWVDMIIKKIAETVAPHFPNCNLRVIGPFGIGQACSVLFVRKDAPAGHRFSAAYCKGITLVPGDLVRDETGDNGKYPEGPVGRLSGLHHPEVPVPPEADVDWLLQHVR